MTFPGTTRAQYSRAQQPPRAARPRPAPARRQPALIPLYALPAALACILPCDVFFETVSFKQPELFSAAITSNPLTYTLGNAAEPGGCPHHPRLVYELPNSGPLSSSAHCSHLHAAPAMQPYSLLPCNRLCCLGGGDCRSGCGGSEQQLGVTRTRGCGACVPAAEGLPPACHPHLSDSASKVSTIYSCRRARSSLPQGAPTLSRPQTGVQWVAAARASRVRVACNRINCF